MYCTGNLCSKFHAYLWKNKTTVSICISLCTVSYRTRSTVFLPYVFYVKLYTIKMMPIFNERVFSCFSLGMFKTTFLLPTAKVLYGHDLQIRIFFYNENTMCVKLTSRSSFYGVQVCFHPIFLRHNSMKLTQNALLIFTTFPLLHI